MKISLQAKISYKEFKRIFGHMFHYSDEATREKKIREHYDTAIAELESKPKIVKGESKVIEDSNLDRIGQTEVHN